MEQQTGERIGTLETKVAVIQSNYVRRDEFAELRAEVRIGFAEVDSRFAKVDAEFVRLDAKIDTKIDRATVTILKWVFAMQLSTSALLLAGIKYL